MNIGLHMNIQDYIVSNLLSSRLALSTEYLLVKQVNSNGDALTILQLDRIGSS